VKVVLTDSGTNFALRRNVLTISKMSKHFFIAAICLLFAIAAKSQTATASQAPHDTIFKLNGQQLPVDVTTVTPTYVSFVFPGKPEEFTIERKEVHKIVYKTGKIDILNQAAFVVFDETSWEAVWLTEDKREIGNLYVLGEVEAKSPSSARSSAAAKKGAIIKLKKKAANLKATTILITKKQETGGYGEYPGYFIKGIAYGPEPPADATAPTTGQKPSVNDAGM
jgi:hypothetical protein